LAYIGGWVRQAIANAVPPERKRPQRIQAQLEPVKECIDRILQGDQRSPRKQRHTAHRLWVRVRQERLESTVSEGTVRRYVQRRKQE
jgi:hypothetical protein